MLGKWYEYELGVPGETAGGFYPNEPKIFRELYGKDAHVQYEKFTKLSNIEQAGELSRMLEQRDILDIKKQEVQKAKQQAKEAENKARKERIKGAVHDLMNQYSTTEQALPKKKWYQKLFFL